MRWTKQRIIDEIQKLAKRNQPLAYTHVAKRQQALLSAGAYHFGSWSNAVGAAGVWYADQVRRPYWTVQRVIATIKAARKQQKNLHWGAVSRRKDALGRAAHAAVQKRLFGSWARALQASGVDPDEVAMYRRWDKPSLAFELRSRAADDAVLNAGDLQKEDPGLHAACLRHFGSYPAALKAARLNPDKIRRRRTWTKQQVIAALQRRVKRKQGIADQDVRRSDLPLYGACVRLFGRYTKARAAAGIKFQRA
ncbi:MAG TPA: hypothetical protein PKB10_09795 [Tepidisphaeraceae bacterium]|nr:hypothetical protein [Tepidisphaeraceae bacterium]